MTLGDELTKGATDTINADHQRIVGSILREGITLINEMRPDQPALDPDKDHVFLGDQAVVDSMGLVTYLNVVEGLLNSKHGIGIDVISEKAMSMRTSPFLSTSTLRKYLLQELS